MNIFFRNILNNTTIQTFHVLQRFLIIIMQSVLDVPEKLDKIFGILMKLCLLNVNVLIEDETNLMWSLHSYRPYATNCFTFERFKIATFSAKNFTNSPNVPLDNLYAERVFKFPKCKLFIATFPFEPFVIIQNSANGTTTFSGIDVIIVNEVSKALNLIPIYMQPQGKKIRGEVFPNGTGNGALGMVMLMIMTNA